VVGVVQPVRGEVAGPVAEGVAARLAVVLPAGQRGGLPRLGVDAVGLQQRVRGLACGELGQHPQVDRFGHTPHRRDAAGLALIRNDADVAGPGTEPVRDLRVGDENTLGGALVPQPRQAIARGLATVQQQRAVCWTTQVEIDKDGVGRDLPGRVANLEAQLDGLLDAVPMDAFGPHLALWRGAAGRRGEVGQHGAEWRMQLGARRHDAEHELLGRTLPQIGHPQVADNAHSLSIGHR